MFCGGGSLDQLSVTADAQINRTPRRRYPVREEAAGNSLQAVAANISARSAVYMLARLSVAAILVKPQRGLSASAKFILLCAPP